MFVFDSAVPPAIMKYLTVALGISDSEQEEFAMAGYDWFVQGIHQAPRPPALAANMMMCLSSGSPSAWRAAARFRG